MDLCVFFSQYLQSNNAHETRSIRKSTTRGISLVLISITTTLIPPTARSGLWILRRTTPSSHIVSPSHLPPSTLLHVAHSLAPWTTSLPTKPPRLIRLKSKSVLLELRNLLLIIITTAMMSIHTNVLLCGAQYLGSDLSLVSERRKSSPRPKSAYSLMAKSLLVSQLW